MKTPLLTAAALFVGSCGSGYAWSPHPGEAGYGRVASKADAIAAAQVLTDLVGRVIVIGPPHRGRAANLYTGINPSCAGGIERMVGRWKTC